MKIEYILMASVGEGEERQLVFSESFDTSVEVQAALTAAEEAVEAALEVLMDEDLFPPVVPDEVGQVQGSEDFDVNGGF